MRRTGYISVSRSQHFASSNPLTDPGVFKDVKPDNILVDWDYDARGELKVDNLWLL